ncbi:hypothetical protein [Saccharopolyspora sp. NPDC049426]|uniref:hypothetical protein n=1 Tax=Saccharopolyspora sp. NPDC049426 TaxID=3155652 RepID=UPI003421BB20
MSTKWARRALNHTVRGDSLAELELLARQVNLNAGGKPVPPVEAVLFPVEVDLAKHKVSAKDVVDDQRCDVAVAPRRIVGLPASAFKVVRGTGISRPTGAKGFIEDKKIPRAHVGSVAACTDIARRD